jgi:hypothetical protein
MKEIVQRVAAIPWGEARDVETVLQKNCGTCTGKHLLLQKYFDDEGIEYRPVVCIFRWQDQNLQLPDHLQSILDDNEWVHGHNFVQVKNSADEWIDVDVTWDAPLAAYGFRTLPEDWDGETSFVGVQSIVERWDNVSILDKKKDLIVSLTPEQQLAREKFLEGFVEWIDRLR